jgi:glucose 1-dehydrogenase
MAGRLAGKVALITGSDSGIGQGTAIEFAKEGADIVITYFHDEDGAKETLRQVEQQGRQGLILQLDQRQEKNVEEVFDKAVAEFGTVHILVNNAGIDSSGMEVAEMPTEEWDNRIKTYLYGVFFCCRRFINIRRKDGGGGKIVNVTSIHQTVPRAGATGYDTAKGGIMNITRSLALEIAKDKINVNNLAPGMVLTPFNQAAVDDPKVREKQVQSIPWKRAAEPWEIGKGAVYLASEDADYVHGTTLVMDGGLMQNTGQGA